MLLVSTGFKTAILGPQSFAQIFNGGSLRIFAGARPSRADAAEPSAPIATVFRADSSGLLFFQAGQYVIKQPADTWLMTTLQPLVPTWFRLVAPGDTYAASMTAARIDGDVGTVAAPLDMVISATTPFTPNTTLPFDSFLFTIPPVPGP